MTEATELLAGARRAFADAVHELVGRRPDTIIGDEYTRHVILDDRYTELVEARYGQQQADNGGLRGVYKSKPPLWIEACSLIDLIDRTVASWWPKPPVGEQPVTIRRLYALTDYGWRPQDVDALHEMTRVVSGWVDRINQLLPEEPRHEWELTAACPACGESTVLVDDGAGEIVRRAALRANQSSAVCLACGADWRPEAFVHLAQQIGAGLPPGVLE
ncbi:hypothetical protein IU449_27085 [Nocardia higoensis]|uniref:Uncharacterized protein n=1 Tax=Nocardia higoensis TaxID=228599 RepID=A0ABS0DI69_9NOCA|nr:hypothetical protein [Nocardia higoensis]MBF6358166.1 hypothetical protein [Nocardia higoensis]